MYFIKIIDVYNGFVYCVRNWIKENWKNLCEKILIFEDF